MPFSLAPLLIHDDRVPLEARRALSAAYAAPPERRRPMLELAARVLHASTNVACTDVRELFGLPADVSCG